MHCPPECHARASIVTPPKLMAYSPSTPLPACLRRLPTTSNGGGLTKQTRELKPWFRDWKHNWLILINRFRRAYSGAAEGTVFLEAVQARAAAMRRVHEARGG